MCKQLRDMRKQKIAVQRTIEHELTENYILLVVGVNDWLATLNGSDITTLCQMLDLSRATFYRRLSSGVWSPFEIITILDFKASKKNGQVSN